MRLWILTLTLLAGCYGNDMTYSYLSFNDDPTGEQLVVQAQTNWCWLAVAEIMSGEPQCKLASTVRPSLKDVDCCDPENAEKCDKPGNTTDALNAVGIKARNMGVLPQDELNAELAAGRPLGITQQGTGLSHEVLIYSRHEDGVRYRVWDPGMNHGWRFLTYAEIKSGMYEKQGVPDSHWTHSTELMDN